MYGKSKPPVCRVHFCEKIGCTRRPLLEAHIHAAYARAYGADLQEFMPLLIGLEADDGRILGAMGLRVADEERLLLEHYLELPIEQTLASRLGRPVERASVVELGNLAAGSPGAARLLVVALNAYLHAAGFEWVSFTAVPALRNVFSRLGLGLMELAPAEARRLGDSQNRWGTYYRQRPVVMAGDIEYGFGRIGRLIQAERTQSLLSRLWHDAGDRGRLALGSRA
jgi:hypothetical protein